MKRSLLCLSLLFLGCGQPNRENNTHIRSGNLKAESASDIALDSQYNGAYQHHIITAGSMNDARAAHTSTLLNNGKVLICGGMVGRRYISSVEIYDPALNTFRQAGNMSVPRVNHSATLLPDGRVLIAGGYDGNYLSSSEIFDPQTETFAPGSNMKTPRMGHTATLLNNGEILFAGGVGTGWTFLQSAEVYNIDSKSFSFTGSMTTERESHTATLLNNGDVLITGGHKGRRANIEIYSSSEIYNPDSGTFTKTGNMTIIRHKHDAVLMADGKVLITGGSNERDYDGKYKTTEVYDPDVRTFKSASNMNIPRFKHIGTSILLPNGNILVAGGADRAELFIAAKNKFEIVDGTMKTDWFFSSAMLMQNGNVLITGGYDENINSGNNAWIYTHSN